MAKIADAYAADRFERYRAHPGRSHPLRPYALRLDRTEHLSGVRRHSQHRELG